MIAPGFDPMQQVLFSKIELTVDRLFAGHEFSYYLTVGIDMDNA